MRARIPVVLCAVAAAVTGPAAWAQSEPVAQARTALLAGNYAAAERLLSAEQRIYPRRSEVLLNLAALYATTGRSGDAVQLYRTVLAQPDAVMDVGADRTASAHLIARRGLERLTGVQTAAR
jgi:thioredoxin-like negative regulator of GroEL